MASADQNYDREYYRSHLGVGHDIPYERNDHWLGFFSGVADQIVQRLRPATVLDAGCALGFLVESLRNRGIDAEGVDVSSFAIGEAHDSVADHLRVGSLTDPIEGRYDLVTCIEVIEHLPASDAPVAFKHIAEVTDRLLLSTTPTDFAEPTHLNVQPPEYWAALLADLGFVRSTEFDASFLTPWAALYERRDTRLAEVVTSFERERWHLVRERNALREALLAAEVAPSQRETDPDLEGLKSDLRTAIDTAHAADARRASVESRLAHVEYALTAAKAREEQVEELVAQIDEIAGGDIARLLVEHRQLTELRDSRSFKAIWKMLAPYRRLRGGR